MTAHSGTLAGASLGAESIADRLMRRRRRRPAFVGVPLTAMIDIVFLLLLYFLLSMQSRPREAIFALDLQIDQDESSTEETVDTDPFALQEPPMVIVVGSTGVGRDACTLDVRPIIASAGPPPRSIAELRPYLRSLRASDDGSTGLFRDSQTVIIQSSDATTRWEHVMGVYSAARQAGLTQITFEEPTS